MDNRKSRNRKPQSKGKFAPRGKDRDKETELNIPDKDLNKEDLAPFYKSKKNDVAWYSRNKQLMVDAASFSTGYPMGLRPEGFKYSNMLFPEYGVPGIMTLDFVPSIGESVAGQSPINSAARMIYSYVRYANSGSAVGNPSDMIMYMLAADSLYMLHQIGVRAYGLARLRDYENQYLPQALVEASGFDYEDIVGNLAQFRYYLNQLAIKINRIAVPADMTYFLRHSWLCSGVYKDAPTNKSQMYVFRPTHFYKYTEATSGPNKLVLQSPYLVAPNDIGSTAHIGQKLTVNNYIGFVGELLDAVLQSEAFGITTGDIMKAFGRDRLFMLAEIADTYEVIPSYNEEVLSQVANAQIAYFFDPWDWGGNFETAPLADGPLAVTQTTNVNSDMWLKVNPAVYGSFVDNELMHGCGLAAWIASKGRYLTTNKDALTPDDAVIASRFSLNTQLSEVVKKTNKSVCMKTTLSGWGSEIMHQAYITTVKLRTPSTGEYEVAYLPVLPYMPGIATTIKADADITLHGHMQLDCFDWHPGVPYGMFTSATTPAAASSKASWTTFLTDVTGARYYGDMRDINNFGFIGPEAIARMNEVALLSLFDSPNIQMLAAKPGK